MRSFSTANRIISDESAPYLIVEISHNHLGSLTLAQECIRLAAEAGADAVKFQKRGPSTYAGLRAAGESEYADMREVREFKLEAYLELAYAAHEQGIHFIATAFDQESVAFLPQVTDAIKIASGDVTNTPLIEAVAATGKPILLSTGGATREDVYEAAGLLQRLGARFSLLHCTSSYPCALGDANLRLIETYRRAFPNVVIGLSSHIHREDAIWTAAMAYTMGARLFEFHFTITPAINAGEHAFALTPESLAEVCRVLRNCDLPLGSDWKERLDCEQQGVLRLGKHLVYRQALPAGHRLSPEDFAVEAPGNGVPPNRARRWSGWTLVRAVKAGESVREGDAEAVA